MRLLFAALAVIFCQQIYAQQLWLHHDIIDSTTEMERIPSTRSGQIYVMQFYTLPQKAEKLQLIEEGITFWDYLPENAYVVTFKPGFDVALLYRRSIKAFFEMDASLKIKKELLDNTLGDWAVEGSNYLINCKYLPLGDLNLLASKIEAKGGTILKRMPQENEMQLKVPAANLIDIAAISSILYLEPIAPDGIQEDNRGRALHRSNRLDVNRGVGYRLDGAGTKVLVRDDGDIGPHIDFHNRVDNGNASNNATVPGNTNHGDGVAGIVGAAGNLDPMMMGMAKGAFIYTTDYENSYTDTTIGLHKYEGVNVTNSSYSDGCNTPTIVTQRIDQQLYDNPKLMHVFSAGNSNSTNCNYKGGAAGTQWGNITGGHKVAKNCIATGNLNPQLGLDATSSRGPAYDGRIKPDICANGTNQNSNNPNNAYKVFGGTSAAAPGIAGILAQLMQGYRQLNNNEDADGALLKSTLLNTANDMGNAGPDFKYGWGHVNAYRAYKLLEEKRWSSNSIEQGAKQNATILVNDDVKEVRFMLYWADHAPSLLAKSSLVNNLDLKVIDPTGKEFLPWVLDTTPNATKLDLPATRGIDNLNNVEQVLIKNPVQGTYSIVVDGKIIPQGPQTYYLLHEFIANNDLVLTYPTGGESLVPGDKLGIFWDTQNDDDYTVSYSLDDKNSWTVIGKTTGTTRYVDWTVPAALSGKVWVKVQGKNSVDESDSPISIIATPNGFKADKVCPDSMTISWNAVAGADFYTVYALGAKYMDSIGTSLTNSFTYPIANPTKDNWFAVAANGFEQIVGRRSIAVRHNAGLKNCPQNYDLSAVQILTPTTKKFSCNTLNDALSVNFKNTGSSVLTNATVSYQSGNGPVVTEVITDSIGPGASVNYTFKALLTIDQSVNTTIKVWTNVPGDVATFNDTVQLDVRYFLQKDEMAYDVIEDFESLSFPPANWEIENTDKTTWAKVNCFGASGQPTQAAFLETNRYKGAISGARDRLYLPKITLPASGDDPFLSFDISHARRNTSTTDSLLIYVYEDCGNKLSEVIWRRGSLTMASAPNTSAYWTPTSKTHWRDFAINLSKYKNKTISIVFESINGNSNNIYLDNINIGTKVIETPTADFTINKAEACITVDTLTLTPLISSGNTLSYLWSFGAGSLPYTTSAVAGPHRIRWNTPGTKTITFTAFNTADTVQITKTIVIRPAPTTQFNFTKSNNNVKFNNLTINAISYLWEFGDGESSTEINPEHQYLTNGLYAVTLTSTGLCGITKTTNTVSITTSLGELADRNICTISPTISSREVQIRTMLQQAEKLTHTVYDATGRLVKSIPTETAAGEQYYKFDISNLGVGVYLVKTKIGDEWVLNKFIKQ